MPRCGCQAGEALKADGEATRGVNKQISPRCVCSPLFDLLSWAQLVANSWRFFHGAHAQGKASAEQLGGLHPTLLQHSQLPSLSRDLGRAPCSACVSQTYVCKGSRCWGCCLPILSALTTALGALPLFITSEKQEHGISLHGDAVY